MFLFGELLVLFYLSHARAQDSNCDFVQNVSPGITYYVNSPNYPNNYSPGVRCRWIAICPTGYNCRLDCPVIALPQSPSCSLDKLMISRTGDPLLNAADTHCGQGTLSIVSTQQRISLALITSRSSPGGRFLCQITAQLTTNVGSTCRCGERKQNRIVGGQETRVNEFKMMAGIAFVDIARLRCGGVIITNRHILTAAHCVLDEKITNLAVIVGEHDITTNTDTPSAKGYGVRRKTIHPQYNPSSYDYDIAILETSSPIEFNDNVGPVCLPYKFINDDFTGKNLTILGWGLLYPGGPDSNVLMKVDVKVISQADCRYRVPNLTDRQICTYTPGKDACQDDSGGPLLYGDPSNGLLYNMAIVSYGKSCASREPGINTRVTALLNWITTNAPYNYCVK